MKSEDALIIDFQKEQDIQQINQILRLFSPSFVFGLRCGLEAIIRVQHLIPSKNRNRRPVIPLRQASPTRGFVPAYAARETMHLRNPLALSPRCAPRTLQNSL